MTRKKTAEAFNHLMLIFIEGSPEDKEDLQSAVDQWFRSRHRAKRLAVMPYGKRESNDVNMTGEEDVEL